MSALALLAAALLYAAVVALVLAPFRVGAAADDLSRDAGPYRRRTSPGRGERDRIAAVTAGESFGAGDRDAHTHPTRTGA